MHALPKVQSADGMLGWFVWIRWNLYSVREEKELNCMETIIRRDACVHRKMATATTQTL